MPEFPNFKKFLSKEKISVGLNIGVSSIKMVRLVFAKDAVKLSAFCVEENQIDQDAVLKKIVQANSIKKINISVSGQQAITRYIELPRMNAGELRQSLKFEAQKHIPFPIAEVNLDACILRSDLPDNKMKVLLAAVKKDSLSQRLKLLSGLDLEVGVVDVDSLALMNAFEFNYAQEENIKNRTLALLNIGSSTSNLNIMDSGYPALSRDINIGGNNFTQRASDVLGVDFKTAELMKVAQEKVKADKLAMAIEPVLAKLAQEVRTSFDFFESRSVTSVEKIFLSGGASLMAGVKESLANLLGLEVVNWDPFKRISAVEGIEQEKLKGLSSQLAVAVGLALRQ
ncbi:MAG: type IV pilus assembly protein PilM [Candidatus Omnitrophica bacterium]|nr:type IV pilus assembly protein PilM [Candidatus Omnitrophota bacterium]